MASDCTFDRRGNFYGQGLYKTPSSTPGSARPKPVLRARSFENVTPWQRRDLINWSWGIYAKIANVRGAIHFKTDFACSDGCFVEYQGANKAWGATMEKFINETYYANCNLAGENHDFHTTLAAVSIALETHGQVGWMFDNESGKIKLISGNSIGNGMSPDSKSGQVFELGNVNTSLTYWGLSTGSGGFANQLLIEKGPFAGNFIIDGIIVDKQLRTLGYRLIGFDAAGAPAYADFPVGQVNLIFEPKFTDQIMGYPGLSGIIESVGTVDDWNYYIGQAMKLSAAMSVTRKTKDGKPPGGGVGYTFVAADGTAGSAAPGEPVPAGSSRVQAFEIVQAGLVELATDNNEEIQAVPFERPSMNEESFVERIETGFFADLWPRGFMYNAASGRASVRIDVVQARQIVWKRHKTLARFAKQWLRRKIANAMAKDELPKNESFSDPYLIGISTPAEISVDEGNDLKGDLNLLGRGATSFKIITQKYGHNEEKIDADNFATLSRRMTKAKEIFKSQENMDEKGVPILTVKEILQRIDNSGNPNQQIDVGAVNTEDATTPPPTAPAKTPAKGKE